MFHNQTECVYNEKLEGMYIHTYRRPLYVLIGHVMYNTYMSINKCILFWTIIGIVKMMMIVWVI